jgi:broad specificity phosphatase PhoE
MPLELYLIRHGQSVNNITEGIIGGQAIDVPLTEYGEQQAHLLGQYLHDQGIILNDAYSSTAERAIRTGSITCSYLGIKGIVTSKKLLEISQGDWAGKRRDSVYTPALKRIIEQENPQHFRPPNGESHQDVEDRGLDFLKNDLGYEHRTGRIAVFGHGMLFKCMLRGILDFDPRMVWKIGIGNTSITSLRYDDRGWHLNYVNAAPHLNLWRRDYAA